MNRTESIYDVYKNIQPLNFGRRFMFQKYVLDEIEKNKICFDEVDEEKLRKEFLTDEFLYGEYIKELEALQCKIVFKGERSNTCNTWNTMAKIYVSVIAAIYVFSL